LPLVHRRSAPPTQPPRHGPLRQTHMRESNAGEESARRAATRRRVPWLPPRGAVRRLRRLPSSHYLVEASTTNVAYGLSLGLAARVPRKIAWRRQRPTLGGIQLAPANPPESTRA